MSQKEIETGTEEESPKAAVAAKAPEAPKSGSRKPATIGSSIVIHGDVAGEEDLIVDGTIEQIPCSSPTHINGYLVIFSCISLKRNLAMQRRINE